MVERDFASLQVEVFGTTTPTHIQAPCFGAAVDLTSLQLTEAQQADLTKVLHLIGHRHPHLEFVPLFPAMAGILSTLCSARGAFACMEAIIRGGSSQTEPKDWPFFPQSRREGLIFGRIFEDLVLKFVPSVSRHLLKLLKDEAESSPQWHRLLSELFIGILPQHSILRILDSYVIEGYKVLFRFALAHVALRQHCLLHTNTCRDFFRELLAPVSDDPDAYAFKLLQKTAYNFKISRGILARSKNRHRKLSLDDFEDEDRAIMLQRTLPRLLRPSSFVSELDWASIWSWIPARFRILDLELVFTTAEHGYRLGTLFERAGDAEPLLILVETTDGNMFGAYLSRSLQNRSTRKFFGTGETCLFNLRPHPVVFRWDESHDNQQFIYGDENFLAIGCSAGKFGMWLDRDLNQVVSSACDTFRNPSLIEHESGWSDVYCVEVFKFH